ncbi:hypothetical protein OW763_07135 [Clostridium aestuarii]|uniref:Uncharacterized protein n=1 Tax=Clostridium aestuarii TaxID=338193 RepID=A0ABT4CYT0_9CLOT|nr:hypothetical protein [Clostridium aestuarii]MCY6484126.1 hypothetical protein [Clostridium aestuarii]
MDTYVIANIDKTVVKIKGLKIKGIKPFEIEKRLTEIIGRHLRVIGVTGNSIDMDVYGLEPEAILKNEEGIIKTISIVEGITASEVTKIDSAEKALEVDIEDIPKGTNYGCARERWIDIDK